MEPEIVRITDRCLFHQVCTMNEDECPTGALKTFGNYYTVEQVIAEIEKDEIFYNSSNGGVTLSGGEILAQWEFAVELLKKLKNIGIHTAIETSGAGSKKGLYEMSYYLDLVLFDFKIWNKTDALRILHANNDVILRNFELLLDKGIPVIPRIPLIPKYTMTEENIIPIIEYLKRNQIKEVHLLPFHQYGSKKYEYLGKNYLLKDVEPPDEKEIDHYKKLVESFGIHAVVGGL